MTTEPPLQQQPLRFVTFPPLDTQCPMAEVSQVWWIFVSGEHFWVTLRLFTVHTQLIDTTILHGNGIQYNSSYSNDTRAVSSPSGLVVVGYLVVNPSPCFLSSSVLPKTRGQNMSTFASSLVPDIVRYLLAAGAPANDVAEKGWTALMTAAAEGHPEVVQDLLAYGACIDTRNRNGCTSLIMAASKGRTGECNYCTRSIERKYTVYI